MSKSNIPYVCPAEFAGSLDNVFRRMVHKPGKILGPYITEGMTVLDLGCGPGYFTTEIARLVGENGRVIAADLQPGMIDKMMVKVRAAGLERVVEPHICRSDSIAVDQKVDFVLAFWMVHEVPDQERLFRELKTILTRGGRIWIIEPKIHVTRKSFDKMIHILGSAGLQITGMPGVPISRTVMVESRDA